MQTEHPTTRLEQLITSEQMLFALLCHQWDTFLLSSIEKLQLPGPDVVGAVHLIWEVKRGLQQIEQAFSPPKYRIKESTTNGNDT